MRWLLIPLSVVGLGGLVMGMASNGWGIGGSTLGGVAVALMLAPVTAAAASVGIIRVGQAVAPILLMLMGGGLGGTAYLLAVEGVQTGPMLIAAIAAFSLGALWLFVAAYVAGVSIPAGREAPRSRQELDALGLMAWATAGASVFILMTSLGPEDDRGIFLRIALALMVGPASTFIAVRAKAWSAIASEATDIPAALRLATAGWIALLGFWVLAERIGGEGTFVFATRGTFAVLAMTGITFGARSVRPFGGKPPTMGAGRIWAGVAAYPIELIGVVVWTVMLAFGPAPWSRIATAIVGGLLGAGFVLHIGLRAARQWRERLAPTQAPADRRTSWFLSGAHGLLLAAIPASLAAYGADGGTWYAAPVVLLWTAIWFMLGSPAFMYLTAARRPIGRVTPSTLTTAQRHGRNISFAVAAGFVGLGGLGLLMYSPSDDPFGLGGAIIGVLTLWPALIAAAIGLVIWTIGFRRALMDGSPGAPSGSGALRGRANVHE